MPWFLAPPPSLFLPLLSKSTPRAPLEGGLPPLRGGGAGAAAPGEKSCIFGLGLGSERSVFVEVHPATRGCGPSRIVAGAGRSRLAYSRVRAVSFWPSPSRGDARVRAVPVPADVLRVRPDPVKGPMARVWPVPVKLVRRVRLVDPAIEVGFLAKSIPHPQGAGLRVASAARSRHAVPRAAGADRSRDIPRARASRPPFGAQSLCHLVSTS